ncbi:TPA: hypothetical protein ACH3X3_013526 [Trebouxia sp. C0006]
MALLRLRTNFASRCSAPIQELELYLPLALFIAYERNKGNETSMWRDNIETERHKARLQADATAELFGKELRVTSDDVMWGLGQVQVRSFGIRWEHYLMPGIDLQPFSKRQLCIHPRALASRQGEKMCVSSMWDHSPKALAAGDELCISYAYNCDPIPKMARIQKYWAFLRHGFVPFEYLPVCRS